MPLAACQPALDAFVQVPGSRLGPQSPWAATIPLSSNLEPPRAKPSLMYFWGPRSWLVTWIRSWSRMNGCGGFQEMPSVYIVCVCNCVSSGLQVCVCLNVCCLRGRYICTFACVWLFCNVSVFEGLCLSFPFRARVAWLWILGRNLSLCVCCLGISENIFSSLGLCVCVVEWWPREQLGGWGPGPTMGPHLLTSPSRYCTRAG